MYKIKLKRGDKVRVITGVDSGKEGKILVVDRKKNRIIVEGLNLNKKHTKARSAEDKGGIIEIEGPINVSNVVYLHKGKPTKLSYKIEDGKKVRVARATGEIIK